MPDESKRILIGRVSGIYGVKGWLKIESYTRPRENILTYGTLSLDVDGQIREYRLRDSHMQGRQIRVALDGLEDRDMAKSLVGTDIMIYRSQMQDLPSGHYYCADLMGMQVVNLQGNRLGTLTDIFETGANDVLEVTGDKRYLIPLVWDRYVRDVDEQGRMIYVDWEWSE